MDTPTWEEIGALLAVVGDECWRTGLMPPVLMGEDRDECQDDEMIAHMGMRGIDEDRAKELLGVSLETIVEMSRNVF
jgi:hypothetical protein